MYVVSVNEMSCLIDRTWFCYIHCMKGSPVFAISPVTATPYNIGYGLLYRSLCIIL